MKIGILYADSKERYIDDLIVSKSIEGEPANLQRMDTQQWSSSIKFGNIGVGKVSAGICTQAFINSYRDLDLYILMGTAGILNPALAIGTVVIGYESLQYDVSKPGTTSDIHDSFTRRFAINAVSEEIISIAQYSIQMHYSKNTKKCVFGRVLTGDGWLADAKHAENLHINLGGDCVDQESAAFAQACALNKKQYLVVKGLTDKPGPGNHDAYESNVASSSRAACLFIRQFLNSYQKLS